ncbi:MAG: L,D-transpeptidase [Polyangiaceae bacterium]|nr:L,D-transpeptidase [Polyangiaceae bacterium]
MRSVSAITAGFVAASFGLVACKAHPVTTPALSKTGTDETTTETPTATEFNAKLVVIRDRAPVMEQPSFGARIVGELRLGATVARSAHAVSHSGCVGGWYAISPKGFVCAGGLATIDVGAASWLPKGPDLSRPLPYRYGRTRTDGVPLYRKAPTADEQASAEPDLSKYLSRLDLDKEVYGPSANDVPLDARGVPTGPPLLAPTSDGVDAGNKRSGASFFTFPVERPSSVFPAFSRAANDGNGDGPQKLRKTSGVAITSIGTVETVGRSRRFGLTPDGMIVAVDRLKPALGSTWHGMDLEKTGLPIAFVHKNGVHTWKLHKGDADKMDDELERRACVPLTGKFRTVDGIRFEEAQEGFWVRAQDLTMVVRRSKFPEFAKGTQKWLDVSLANQTITAYEGRKAIFATLISSGRDVLGDPQQAASTPRGTFRVRSKHVSLPLDPREVNQVFDVAEAPWTIALDGGFAITGTYWSEVGEAQGFHNIALSPIDARRIWMWAAPEVAEGWHATYETGDSPTIVFVRP